MVGSGPEGSPLFVGGQPHKNSRFNGDPEFSDKGPRIPRRVKGKWDEASVEQDLPIIGETKTLLDAIEKAENSDNSDSVKKILQAKLEKLGWIYNSNATFKANFPFRNKYLILEATYKRHYAPDIHRIKVSMRNNSVSDYKLMKWISK